MASSKTKKFYELAKANGLVDLERIGAGGQGTIYQARIVGDGRPVAIKRLQNRDRIGRFAVEIATMQRLLDDGCTSIPAILGNLSNPDESFFWMPFYPDGSLQRALDDRTIGNPRELCIRLVEALCDLHRFEVAHRDLKPDNVLFDGDRPLLADFGLCLWIDTDDRQTASHEQVGPRKYMAPEMRDGRRDDLDHRSADRYSMAKILWCVLANRQTPFDAGADHAKVAHLPSTITRDPSLRPVEELVNRWMRDNPLERFAVSPDEIIDALRTSAEPARPAIVGLPTDPAVIENLQRRDAAYRQRQAEQAEEMRKSTMLIEQERIDRLESWFGRLTQVVNDATTDAPENKIFHEYWDAAPTYLRIDPTDQEFPPLQRLTETDPLRKALIGTSLDQQPPTRGGAGGGGLISSLTGFRRSRSLWAVQIRVGYGPTVRICLHADLNAEWIVLSLTTIRDLAGWAIDPRDPPPIAEKLTPLHLSTEHRVDVFVGEALRRTIDFIQRAATVDPGDL